MKLQYLGDYRDAFKWDLLHWLCSRSEPGFRSLLFVPFLTADDENPRDGQIPHDRFAARAVVQRFVAALRAGPRRLEAVTPLGAIDAERPFTVTIHSPAGVVPRGSARSDYWNGLPLPASSIVFIDPDNGFETKTRKGPKWVRHTEVESLLARLPESSAVVVYQHRPRKTWKQVFDSLAPRLSYAAHAVATFDSTLAFIILARSAKVSERLLAAAQEYARQHGTVECAALSGRGA